MTRHLPLLPLFLLWACVPLRAQHATSPQPVSSRVVAAKVFLKGAWVTREGKTHLPAGRHELVFSGLPAKFDRKTLRVRGTGAFTILAVNTSLDYLARKEKQAQLAALEAEAYRLKRQIEEIGVSLRQLDWQERLLSQNSKVAGTQAPLDAQTLDEVLALHRREIAHILSEKLTLDRQKKTLDSLLQRVEQQMREVQTADERPVGKVHVWVEAENPVDAVVRLEYYVAEASWFATYDLRAEGLQQPVRLELKAGISQSTGEDWSEVQLTLSTGDPGADFQMPKLRPWYLRPGVGWSAALAGTTVSGQVLDERGQPLVGASVVVPGTSIGTVTDFEGRFQLVLPTDHNELEVSYVGYAPRRLTGVAPGQRLVLRLQPEMILMEEVEIARASRPHRAAPRRKAEEEAAPALEVVETGRATQVEFRIEKPWTIPSDGKPRTVDVKVELVPAAFEYYTAPRASEAAFLKAYLSEWSGRNLVAGTANLFYEGSWLGQTLLDPTVAADTLEIGFGRDKGVVVDRVPITERVRKQFIGNKRTAERAYRIAVRNAKSEPIRIVVQDQIPLAAHEDIEVTLLERSGAEFDAETGILTWRLQLAPGQKRELTFAYEVRYPKHLHLVLD